MATIAVDFDGTIVTHEYPKIGTELPFATETLKMLIRDHHKLILWSVREGKLLDEACLLYTLRAHATPEHLVCRLLLEKKNRHAPAP